MKIMFLITNQINLMKGFKFSAVVVMGALAIGFTSCDDDDKEVVEEVKVTVPDDASILSDKETANCYIAAPGNVVAFSTQYKGNSTTLEVGDVADVKLVWMDKASLVKDVKYAVDDKMAVVWLGEQEGNALVAAVDNSGNTLWSWHLWVTDYDPEASSFTTAANANGTTWTFMDRNLGALSADPSAGFATHGMLYQWGRKDPFPSPVSYTELDENYNYVSGKDGEAQLYDIENNQLPSIGSLTQVHGTVDLSVANPMTFYAMTYKYTGEVDEYGEEIRLNDPLTGDWADVSDDDRWGGVSMKKSIYDPCPPGWKVPVCDAAGATPYDWLKYASMTWDESAKGAMQDGQWFPATGTRAYVSGACDFPDANHYSGLWIGTAGKAASDLVQYPTLYGQYMFVINGKRTFKVNKDRRSQGMSLRAVADR